MKSALTIAGSDSSGGAGIHADLRTFYAHGLHGASALSVVTAQNTVGVRAVHHVPTDFVVAQVEAVLDDLDVVCVKTGLLFDADTVRAIGRLAAAGRLPSLVVDPVLADASGRRFVSDDTVAAYLDDLIPHARVITPNRVEAGMLVGRELRTTRDMAAAAEELVRLGPDVVVVTGGDADDEGDQAIDVAVYRNGRIIWMGKPRIETANDHGSGCSFAAAAAARLGLGDDLVEALDGAKAFVHRGLAGAVDWTIGSGHGPIDHFGWIDQHGTG